MEATDMRRFSFGVGAAALAAATLIPQVALVAAPRAVGRGTSSSGGADGAPPDQLMLVGTGTATTTPKGFSPVTIQNYYHFNAMGKDAKGNAINGTGQTIAVVLWGNYPQAAADLQAFITQFKLP